MTGIYGANYKLALIMYIFTQGFKYAFEPFFFSYSKHEDSKKVYQDVFLYFTGFGLIIFLGIYVLDRYYQIFCAVLRNIIQVLLLFPGC